jgi:NADH-quinone oxidoreductase subunit L
MSDVVFLLIVFLPIIGALIAGIGGTEAVTRLSRETDGYERPAGAAHAQDHADTWAGQLTSALLLVTMVLSWYAFFNVASSGETHTVELFRWIESGAFGSGWVLYIDMLTAVMLVVVTTVSALVHVYSIGYMSHDPHPARFFAYLSLFTFAMLMLVTADNLLQLFFGWEGVGLASYLLIGFWYNRPSANAAAIKAFIVNRVGDFGFILGIVGTFAVFGTIELGTIFAAVPEQAGETFEFLGMEVDVMTTLAILLFIGAMGKSAQFLLHTWLPDAMEGPTPVSALIHAATMVTAGVFLVARMSPFFEAAPVAQTLRHRGGRHHRVLRRLRRPGPERHQARHRLFDLLSARLHVRRHGGGCLWGGHVPPVHSRLLQGAAVPRRRLGHPCDGRRAGHAQHGRAVFAAQDHLGGDADRHAVAHRLSADRGLLFQGCRHRGGLCVGLRRGQVAFWLVLIAALFTAFYSWRLMFLTFHGRPRASREVMSQAHESPNVMLVPLYGLAAGSLFAGILFANWFIGADEGEFWGQSIHRGPDNHILEALHHVPGWVVWSPAIMMAAGFAIAWLFYIRRPDLPDALARQNAPLYKFLLNKWYFDELYDFLLVRPAMWLGRFLWLKGDGWLIDGFGPDGVSARVLDVTNRVVKLQTGYLYHYAFAMLIGVAALVTYFMFAGL